MTLLLFSGLCQSAHRFYQRLSSGYWLPKRRWFCKSPKELRRKLLPDWSSNKRGRKRLLPYWWCLQFLFVRLFLFLQWHQESHYIGRWWHNSVPNKHPVGRWSVYTQNHHTFRLHQSHRWQYFLFPNLPNGNSGWQKQEGRLSHYSYASSYRHYKSYRWPERSDYHLP